MIDAREQLRRGGDEGRGWLAWGAALATLTAALLVVIMLLAMRLPAAMQARAECLQAAAIEAMQAMRAPVDECPPAPGLLELLDLSAGH